MSSHILLNKKRVIQCELNQRPPANFYFILIKTILVKEMLKIEEIPNIKFTAKLQRGMNDIRKIMAASLFYIYTEIRLGLFVKSVDFSNFV